MIATFQEGFVRIEAEASRLFVGAVTLQAFRDQDRADAAFQTTLNVRRFGQESVRESAPRRSLNERQTAPV